MTKSTLPPLGKLLNVIETLGYNITHQYDDLVFVDNTAFLFRFDEDNDTIHLHFNIECDSDFKDKLSNKTIETAKNEGIDKLNCAADFKLEQKEGEEEIQIRFMA